MIEPLDATRLASYLRRLEIDSVEAASAAFLRRLHRAHLREIAFECLDVCRSIPLSLTADALCDKVLERRRGGFCYELNSLFARLLVSLGYEVQLLAAQVVDTEDQLGPPFDHMALLVHAERSYLCDVGFGKSMVDPLDYAAREHEDATGRYRLRDSKSHVGHLWLEHLDSGRWSPSFLLDPTPRQLEEFQPMLAYHQSDPASPFPHTFLITQLTEHGRLTVRDLQVTETFHGYSCRWTFESERQRDSFVAQRFGPQFCP